MGVRGLGFTETYVWLSGYSRTTQSLDPELNEPLGYRFCELRHLKLCKGSLRCDADDVNRCPGRAVLDYALGSTDDNHITSLGVGKLPI